MPSIQKAFTGIGGFDDMTDGGLPRNRATLLMGGAGCCKTLTALQMLANGARDYKEPGIFVSFEEHPSRIAANAAGFGWDLEKLQPNKLFFLDAQPSLDQARSGQFDLGGLLAVLTAKAREMKARRIVFDAIDIVLSLLNNEAAEKQEIYRLHEWLLDSQLTALITLKSTLTGARNSNPRFDFMQFMVDCVVTLNLQLAGGISNRNLRILKYRGSAFEENEMPFVIAKRGMEVAGLRRRPAAARSAKTTARVSSGIQRLDSMLGGGYYRGAGILVTGSPGTAKTTLAGAFVEAACRRGEKALFVSFDSDAGEVVRNLASVNIQLEPFLKKGLLQTLTARAMTGNGESHLLKLKRMAADHHPACLVIDPVSALIKSGHETLIHGVAERLVDWAKAEGLTLLCTSLLDQSAPDIERSPLQISTIADTWIHLSYLVKAGERNRALTIIKSRGTGHSNQVRELTLKSSGVTLTDVYTAGGEVLMGTLRWEKEQADRMEKAERDAAIKEKSLKTELEEAELKSRLLLLEQQLKAVRHEKQRLANAAAANQDERQLHRKAMEQYRDANDGGPDRRKKR